jgi:hypothetical protein
MKCPICSVDLRDGPYYRDASIVIHLMDDHDWSYHSDDWEPFWKALDANDRETAEEVFTRVGKERFIKAIVENHAIKLLKGG